MTATWGLAEPSGEIHGTEQGGPQVCKPRMNTPVLEAVAGRTHGLPGHSQFSDRKKVSLEVTEGSWEKQTQSFSGHPVGNWLYASSKGKEYVKAPGTSQALKRASLSPHPPFLLSPCTLACPVAGT